METPRACPRRFVSTGWLFAVSFLAAFSLSATMVAGQRASTVSARHTSLSHQGKPTRLKRGRSTSPAEGAARPRIVQASRGLPLAFEPNVGQTDAQVKFLSRGNHYALFLTGTEAVLKLHAGSGPDSRNSTKPDFKSPQKVPPTSVDVLRMELVQGNPHPQLAGLDPLPGRNNYFIGKDPAKWHRNVPTYSRVKYSDVYPGVDLVYYGNQRQLEYDFVVRPGADPKIIQLAVAAVSDPARRDGGTPPLQIDDAGDLVIPTSGGEVRFHKPMIYQPQETPAGARQLVEGKFVLLAGNRVGFEVGGYDKSKPLVIDPTLNYATYLGGSGEDVALAIAGDSSGNAYVTGNTFSVDFPSTDGSKLNTNTPFHVDPEDVFVTKLNPTGTQTEFSTILGGARWAAAGAIAVDSGNNVYLTGVTETTDFPAATEGGSLILDAFVTKLDSTGAVVFSKLLGGSGFDSGTGIKVDSNGNTYVTGITQSSDFEIVNGFQTVCSTCTNYQYDTFVAKLDAAGTTLYSSFLGGNLLEQSNDIAIDGTGKMFVIGTTTSTDFPTTANAPVPTDPDSETHPRPNAFLAEIDPAGNGPTSLLFSTYIGNTSYYSYGNGIAIDSSGNVYVTGATNSPRNPTGVPDVPGFKMTYAGSFDAYIAKFNPNTIQYEYAAFLGGSRDDEGVAIAVDSNGSAFLTGWTRSPDFRLAGALDNTFNTSGGDDAFVAKISPDGMSLSFSTYLGGEGLDVGQSIAVSGTESVLVAGTTSSIDFPTSTDALQTECGGCVIGDAFVASYGGLASRTGSGISVNPTSLGFGSHLVGSPTTMFVTVTNLGTSNLSITSTTFGGMSASDFTLSPSSTCSTSTPVAPNGTCTAVVEFKPGAAGDRPGSLDIASSGGTANVPLKGKGLTLSLAAASGSETSATVAPGGTATYNLTLQAPGFVGDVALSCSGAPQASTCTTSTGIVHLDGTNPGPFTIRVTTTASSLIVPPSPEGPNGPRGKLPQIVPLGLMWSLALLALTGIAARHRRARYVLAAALICVLMWGACGGGGPPPPPRGTPTGVYNLTVSGTAEGVTETIGLVLTVL